MNSITASAGMPADVDPTNTKPRLRSRYEELRDLERGAGEAFGFDEPPRPARWYHLALMAVAVAIVAGVIGKVG